MSSDINYPHLVLHAQLGHQESMARLADLVRDRLFAYIYRLTLNHDLAQDLLQETLLEMVESLKQLEQPDRFWCWLLRIALSKVQHHFRIRQHRKLVQASAVEKQRLSQRASGPYDDGLDNLARRELSDAVFEAMQKLKIRHRNVLALRCFEQMPYSEIALLMSCNELRARVMFFRAKNALRRQLARHGFSKKFLLTGLALFGLITAHAKAASATSTVTAASVEVGFTATLVGILVSRIGVALTTVMTILTITLGVKTFLCVVAITCFVLFCLFLTYLAGIYSS